MRTKMSNITNFNFFNNLFSRPKFTIINRMKTQDVQCSQILKSLKNRYILKEFKKIICLWYEPKAFSTVKFHFKQIIAIFNGKFKGYKKCNTYYHDLNHTKDIFLACIRLIDGYNLKNEKMPQNLVVNLLLAALYHDVGYIQEESDHHGTGAKFTQFHVQRSVEFIENHFVELKIEEENLDIISQLIQSTGLSVDINKLDFVETIELIAGYMLGTADLLGQMADRNYLEKLLFLFYEFKEAGISGYNTEFDILQQTLGFYNLVKNRFSSEFNDVYTYVENHFAERYSIPRNLYIEAIEKHIDYIKRILDDNSTNFRKKLKRMNWTGNSIFL